MSELQPSILDKLKQHRVYGAFLGITLSYFFYKGISYSLIGSYIPLLVILSILTLLIFGVYKSKRAFRSILGLWSILVILWASTRILLSSVNQFIKKIPEGHVDAQLGIMGSLLSLAFLIMGIYLWKYKKKII